MKNIRSGLVVLLTLLLLGGCTMVCNIAGPTGAEQEVLNMAQEVLVLDPEGKLVRTLTTDEELDALLDGLRLEDWTLAQLPQGAVSEGTIVFRQLETLKLGQRWEDRAMVEAARLTVYDQGAYGVLLCGGVSLCFGLPEGTYAQFWE